MKHGQLRLAGSLRSSLRPACGERWPQPDEGGRRKEASQLTLESSPPMASSRPGIALIVAASVRDAPARAESISTRRLSLAAQQQNRTNEPRDSKPRHDRSDCVDGDARSGHDREPSRASSSVFPAYRPLPVPFSRPPRSGCVRRAEIGGDLHRLGEIRTRSKARCKVSPKPDAWPASFVSMRRQGRRRAMRREPRGAVLHAAPHRCRVA